MSNDEIQICGRCWHLPHGEGPCELWGVHCLPGRCSCGRKPTADPALRLPVTAALWEIIEFLQSEVERRVDLAEPVKILAGDIQDVIDVVSRVEAVRIEGRNAYDDFFKTNETHLDDVILRRVRKEGLARLARTAMPAGCEVEADDE